MLDYMRKLTIIMTLFFMMLTNANAQYLAMDGFTCAQVIKFDRNNNKRDIVRTEDWILGYVTGFNYALSGNVGMDATPEGLFYAMLNYCEENPLSSVAEGAEYIIINLID